MARKKLTPREIKGLKAALRAKLGVMADAKPAKSKTAPADDEESPPAKAEKPKRLGYV